MSKQFWSNLEKFMKGTVPPSLKKILQETGYDSDIAIESINSDSIKTLEKHINDRRCLIKDTVYDKYIKENEPFEFLPGHKIVLLNLPNRIKQYKESIISKKIEQSAISKSEEWLKNDIVEKLNVLLDSFGAELKITTANISDFFKKDNICKCKIKCPFCTTETKKYTCTYNGYWSISNLKRHWTDNHKQQVQAGGKIPAETYGSDASKNTADSANETTSTNTAQKPRKVLTTSTSTSLATSSSFEKRLSEACMFNCNELYAQMRRTIRSEN